MSFGCGVDYEAAAADYHAGRALPQAALDAWWAAISPHVPATAPRRVLDLGSGTGIFTRAWRGWCQCEVVGLEPSAGMRSVAAQLGCASVAAVGEATPFRDDTFDVAWLSTVWHQLCDPMRCAVELHRIVRAGGVVLVRGLFADRGEIGWLDAFPGAAAAREAFPSAAATTATFAVAGFGTIGAADVEAPPYSTAQEAAAWARRMRRADTFLGLLSDADFDAGLARLSSASTSDRRAARLSLLVFARGG